MAFFITQLCIIMLHNCVLLFCNIHKQNSELTISYLQDRFKHELVNYDNSNGLEQIIGNIYGVAGIFGIFIDWLQGKIKASPEELGEAIGKFANKYWVMD